MITSQIKDLSLHFLPNLNNIPPPFPMSTLFASGQEAIYKLIASDSFSRFVLTKEFKKIIKDADSEHINEIERGQIDLNTRVKSAFIQNTIAITNEI